MLVHRIEIKKKSVSAQKTTWNGRNVHKESCEDKDKEEEEEEDKEEKKSHC